MSALGTISQHSEECVQTAGAGVADNPAAADIRPFQSTAKGLRV
jgi:hypothetical protein